MNRSLLLSLLALSLPFLLAACDAGVAGDDSAPGVLSEGDYYVDDIFPGDDLSVVEKCAVITGTLIIEGVPLANLDRLSKLTSVGVFLSRQP